MKIRFLNLALKRCAKSTAKHQRMCCVIVRGNAVISIGVNRLYNHAEQRALSKRIDYSGATAYVMRHNAKCSRPCPDCEVRLINAGIKRAVYINWSGKMSVEKYKRIGL